MDERLKKAPETERGPESKGIIVEKQTGHLNN